MSASLNILKRNWQIVNRMQMASPGQQPPVLQPDLLQGLVSCVGLMHMLGIALHVRYYSVATFCTYSEVYRVILQYMFFYLLLIMLFHNKPCHYGLNKCYAMPTIHWWYMTCGLVDRLSECKTKLDPSARSIFIKYISADFADRKRPKIRPSWWMI